MVTCFEASLHNHAQRPPFRPACMTLGCAGTAHACCSIEKSPAKPLLSLRLLASEGCRAICSQGPQSTWVVLTLGGLPQHSKASSPPVAGTAAPVHPSADMARHPAKALPGWHVLGQYHSPLALHPPWARGLPAAQARATWGVRLDTGCSVWLFLRRISAARSATMTTAAPVWPPAPHHHPISAMSCTCS